MMLSAIKTQESVFIDANIFIYHFTGSSKECNEFLKRCESQDIMGITAVTVLAEVTHHLMITEAIKNGFISPQKPTLQLQKRPEIIKKLSAYYLQIMNIAAWGIKIINPPEDIFIKSQIYRSQFGLMTNDSFIPVYMNSSHTDKLATLDQIFNNIPSLQVYLPSDISTFVS